MKTFTFRQLLATAAAFLVCAALAGGMVIWAHKGPVLIGCEVKLEEVNFDSQAGADHGYCRDWAATIRNLFR
ncbi:TPA: hypothetical protein L4936_001244 [Pseudomonas aeruginosa]|uniref:hypothetical protein n=1 Tax=Aquipseudomonas alcaligenes TaxID=43263 RepID=UPI001F217D99|nr:hypothetical protein [Pseudomonas alcaligenes]BDC78602.1 hypothetical protein MRCP2_p3370 [Pseudomonas alcaligenes]HBO6962638.1 hypothetical protein [Pseudomonas aeruginosa]HBO7218303.1 hypothetical protein [Pseudomonas aeruginosa]